MMMLTDWPTDAVFRVFLLLLTVSLVGYVWCLVGCFCCLLLGLQQPQLDCCLTHSSAHIRTVSSSFTVEITNCTNFICFFI